MAVGIQKAWSTSAGSNANADSNIGFAEGQTPASLNNSARAEMAAVKAFANQILGALTSGGSANAQTLTSDAPGAISTAYAAGMGFVFRAGYTNSGACTLNVDGVGAKSIKKGGALAALAANDIVAGGIYFVVYQATGDCFVLLNPESGQIAAQPLDATLTAIAALGYTSGSYLIKKTAADTWSLVDEATYAHLAGSETFTGSKTFSAAVTININASSAPTPPGSTYLHVIGADSASPRTEYDSFAGAGVMEFRRANGTNASKSAVVSGDIIGTFQAAGYGATAYIGARASVRFVAAQNWTDSVQGTFGTFYSCSLGAAAQSERYRFGDFTSSSEMGYRDGGPGSVPDATYTFALTDRGTPTDHSSGSAHTYTVPPQSSVAMPANAVLYGTNWGAGTLTIARGVGVTFRDAAGTNADLSIAQYQSYSLRRHPTSSDTWTVRTA